MIEVRDNLRVVSNGVVDKMLAEDNCYTQLLKCIDKLPRKTRRMVDAWWIQVLKSRREL